MAACLKPLRKLVGIGQNVFDPATSCKIVSQAKFNAILHWKYSAGTNEDIAGGANEAGTV